jgi:hypothetical protein
MMNSPVGSLIAEDICNRLHSQPANRFELRAAGRVADGLALLDKAAGKRIRAKRI